MAKIAVSYLTSIPGRSEPDEEPRYIKSSASSSEVSRLVEKGNFSIATAVPIVIPSIAKQEIISAGWMSLFLAITSQVFSENPEPRLAEGVLMNGVPFGAVPCGPVVLEPLGLASPSPASSDCVGRH